MICYKLPIKIYYKDVDKMGIVYYSRYFEYFEQARTELLKSIGLSLISMEREGLFLPVISAHCKYMRSLNLEQEAIINAGISDLPKSKLKIFYILKTNCNKRAFVNGYTEHAFINDLGKPTRPPKFFLSILKKNGLK